jgi:prepilin-type N-terminal cleavage/methylation domain-containing protein
MAIFNQNKKAFTLIEILVSMLLLGFILLTSVRAYSFLSSNSKIDEIRFLALKTIDSEMNRLVFAYENLEQSTFAKIYFIADHSSNDHTRGEYDKYFKIKTDIFGLTSYDDKIRIYKKNPLKESYGLSISGGWEDYINIVEILDTTNTVGEVQKGDIVGLIAWKIKKSSSSLPNCSSNPPKCRADLSLSITYPYRMLDFTSRNGAAKIEKIPNIPLETINLKTTTKVKEF